MVSSYATPAPLRQGQDDPPFTARGSFPHLLGVLHAQARAGQLGHETVQCPGCTWQIPYTSTRVKVQLRYCSSKVVDDGST